MKRKHKGRICRHWLVDMVIINLVTLVTIYVSHVMHENIVNQLQLALNIMLIKTSGYRISNRYH